VKTVSGLLEKTSSTKAFADLGPPFRSEAPPPRREDSPLPDDLPLDELFPLDDDSPRPLELLRSLRLSSPLLFFLLLMYLLMHLGRKASSRFYLQTFA
jgi:hypothetical protein